MFFHNLSLACFGISAHFFTRNGAMPGVLTTIPHNVEKSLAFFPIGWPSVLKSTTSLSLECLLSNLMSCVGPRVLFFPLQEPVFKV